MENLQSIMNSPALWIVSSFMVIVILVQAAWYLKAALTEAKRLEIPKTDIKNGMSSAMVTAIGPSLALVIVLISIITIVGAPTTWMRLNDIGAGRTEISVITIACELLGVTPGGEGFGIKAFALALWAMALNNFGWLLPTLLLTGRMNSVVVKLNSRYSPKWTKALMGGTTFGIFGYLFINSIWKKTIDPYFILAAALAAVSIVLINKFFGKNKRLQELSIGLAMLIGMFGTTAIKGLIGG